eukprot:7389327-Prymnesium_polylepis.1
MASIVAAASPRASASQTYLVAEWTETLDLPPRDAKGDLFGDTRSRNGARNRRSNPVSVTAKSQKP